MISILKLDDATLFDTLVENIIINKDSKTLVLKYGIKVEIKYKISNLVIDFALLN